MAMKRELLATVAALALIASTNAVSAQSGTEQREMRGPGAAQQQLNNKEQDQGIKSGQMDQKGLGTSGETPKSKKPQQGMDNKKEQGGSQTTQNPNAQKNQGTAQGEQGTQPGVKDKRSTQSPNAQPSPSTAQKEQGTQPGMKEQRSTQTPSQGSAKSVQLSQDQRSKIRTTIINQKPERVTNVNFSVTVGTRVPRTVRFYPLPPEIIVFVPEYRGYEYILVGDEILIIDPRTLEIVAILPA